jgi:hypothetical protein
MVYLLGDQELEVTEEFKTVYTSLEKRRNNCCEGYGTIRG